MLTVCQILSRKPVNPAPKTIPRVPSSTRVRSPLVPDDVHQERVLCGNERLGE